MFYNEQLAMYIYLIESTFFMYAIMDYTHIILQSPMLVFKYIIIIEVLLMLP